MQGRLLPERLDELQVFPESNWQNELNLASSLGFKNFELLYDRQGKLSEILSTTSNWKQLGLQVDCMGKADRVSAGSVCLDFLSRYSLDNGSQREDFILEIVRAIENFKNTSVKILVVPFCHESNLASGKALSEFLSALQNFDLDIIAADAGLNIALEIDLPAQTIVDGFCDFGFKNVGVCFDLGNAKAAGFTPEVDILELRDLVLHVHLKDRSVNGPNVMFGQGQVDFKACLEALYSIDYQGVLICESMYSCDPIAEAERNLKFLRKEVLT